MQPGDIDKLAAAIRADFPGNVAARPAPWDGAPAVKVIDCVLSLGRNYQKVVAPRVDRFAREHPEIASCADLAAAMRTATPSVFLEKALDVRDARRAATLLGVADFALAVQALFPAETEAERLARWAAWARPGDAMAVEVRGFGVAGFQYLRMHFGADTVKPDVHIRRYVEGVLGRPVGDVAMVWLVEQACRKVGASPLAVDARIWQAATGATNGGG